MKVENFTAIIIEIQINPQDLLNDLVYIYIYTLGCSKIFESLNPQVLSSNSLP